jgi:hypothetical protein
LVDHENSGEIEARNADDRGVTRVRLADIAAVLMSLTATVGIVLIISYVESHPMNMPFGSKFVTPATGSAWEVFSDQPLIVSRRQDTLPSLTGCAPRGCAEHEFVYMAAELPLSGESLPKLTLPT